MTAKVEEASDLVQSVSCALFFLFICAVFLKTAKAPIQYCFGGLMVYISPFAREVLCRLRRLLMTSLLQKLMNPSISLGIVPWLSLPLGRSHRSRF
jgi:hypothetical protein